MPNVRIVDADLVARQALAVGAPPYLALRAFIKSHDKYGQYFSRLFNEDGNDESDGDCTEKKKDHDNVQQERQEQTEVDGAKVAEEEAATKVEEAAKRGTVNRELLGQFVFSDPELRRVLNQYTHSWIKDQIWNMIWTEWRRHMFDHDRIVVMDIPLLFEVGQFYRRLASKVICVSTTSELQLQRLTKRNQLSEQEALNRIRSQMPLATKEAMSDYVIRNTGTMSDLHRETIRVFEQCKREASPLGYDTLKVASLVLVTAAVSCAATVTGLSLFLPSSL